MSRPNQPHRIILSNVSYTRLHAFLDRHALRIVVICTMLLLAGSSLCWGQQVAFPTMTAPPRHQPMVIETSLLQEEVDPLAAPVHILGNLRAKGELKRTEVLAPYEQRFLADGTSELDLQLVAADHGMTAGPDSWIVFHGQYILQFQKTGGAR